MRISAQVSLYPLRQQSLAPAIERALAILRRPGLVVRPGRMSTLLTGHSTELFSALEQVFEDTAEGGDVVMVVTFSNACPGS